MTTSLRGGPCWPPSIYDNQVPQPSILLKGALLPFLGHAHRRESARRAIARLSPATGDCAPFRRSGLKF